MLKVEMQDLHRRITCSPLKARASSRLLGSQRQRAAAGISTQQPKIQSAIGYFFVFFLAFARGAAFLAGAALVSRPPIRLKESVALKGNWRTEVWPVVLSVTSTRRLLARMMVRILRRILCRSPGVSSGFCSTELLTSAGVRLCWAPNALVSMLPAGTPFSTRKLRVRSTRRSESAWLNAAEPRGSACPSRISFTSGLLCRYFTKSVASASNVFCWLVTRPPLGLDTVGWAVGK